MRNKEKVSIDQAKHDPDSDESWLNAELNKTSCKVCTDPGIARLKVLLHAAVDAGFQKKLSHPKIYERLSKVVPGFTKRVTFNMLRAHMRLHETGWRS